MHHVEFLLTTHTGNASCLPIHSSMYYPGWPLPFASLHQCPALNPGWSSLQQATDIM
jgi:hypothetical protein